MIPASHNTALELALVLVLGLAVGVVKADPLVRTDPMHLVPIPDDPLRDHPPLQRWPTPSQVVVRSKSEWRLGGKRDVAATSACRAGRFHEITPMLYRAFFSDGTLGVAFGYGLNLYDPDHKANPSLIYLFQFDGLNNCQVLTIPNQDARVQGAGAAR
jgi:hypothetical protein